MSLFADYVKFCVKVEGQGVTLTFDTHRVSVTHLVDCKYKIKVLLSLSGNNSFQKIKISTFPYKRICDQIWSWCKLGQSQASHHLNKVRCAPRPQYYLPSFKTFGPLVPEKKVY